MDGQFKRLPSHRISACCVLVSLLPWLFVAAHGAQEGDFRFEILGAGARITGYTGLGGNVVLPDRLGGVAVTSIGDNAFSRRTNLTSVVIANTVTAIGDDAFSYCRRLTSVTIPNSVTVVGSWAFWGCSSLTNVTIPNSVTFDFGYGVFAYCTNLARVTIGTNVTDIPDGAFSGCTSLTSVTIPNSVEDIGTDAFSGCTGLTNVTIGNSVTFIEDRAFAGCTSLTSVTIPNNVTDTFPDTRDALGEGVFSGCTSLTNIAVDPLNPSYSSAGGVLFNKTRSLLIAYPAGKAGPYTIPDSVFEISQGAFYSCRKLTSVTIGKNPLAREYYSGDLTAFAFRGCTSLTNIAVDPLNPSYSSAGGVLFNKTQSRLVLYPAGNAGPYMIPNSVTAIGDYALYGCSDLTSVTIGTNVTAIGVAAFSYSSLTSVTIPNSVTAIGTDAFSRCTNLTSVTINMPAISYRAFYGFTSLTSLMIGNSVTAIGTDAFYGCSNLTSVVIGTNVTAIGYGAFRGCTSLRSVTIPNSVTVIRDSAFYGCTNLTSVTIPNSVAGIGDGAFSGCTSLRSVTIPNSVTALGWYAFSGCSSLTSVTIGTNVTAIGAQVFSGCTNLTSVTIPNRVTAIETEAFLGCTSLTSVTIPNRVTVIGTDAFRGCTSLTSVVIGTNVTAIGYGAFQGCTSLRSVTIPNSVTALGWYAFSGCSSLTSVYFEGNPPSQGSALFERSPFVTVFIRAGATGWGATFGGRPTAVWELRPGYSEWAMFSGLMAQFPNTSAEGDDPDGDGLSNHDEWRAGTDPTQPASLLALELVPRSADLAGSDRTPVTSGYHAVYFQSVAGRYYGVQSTALIHGPWALERVRLASATQTRFVLAKPTSQRFYRVVLLP